MIKVNCDICGGKIDYEINGVNLNFNHYGTVKMSGPEREYQLCNVCAEEIFDVVSKKAERNGIDIKMGDRIRKDIVEVNN